MRRCASLLAAALVSSSCLISANASAAPCTLISNVNQLQAISNNPSGSFCLANDIDASSKPNFAPIGDSVAGVFSGRFDGRGFAIRNLTIKSATVSPLALFRSTNGAVITNVRLLNVTVRGSKINSGYAGLVGQLAGGSTVANVHVSGSIICTGTNCGAGGVVAGISNDSVLGRSSSSAKVQGTSVAGGLVGSTLTGSIARSYATGSVTCTAMNCIVGGLIGRASLGTIISSSAAVGPVNGTAGGDSRVGGFIGLTESGTSISRSFALGRVTAGSAGLAGSFIGQDNSGGTHDQTYAAGLVTGSGATLGGWTPNAGGTPTNTNAYWDTDTTHQMTSAAGTAQTTAQLRDNLPAGFGGAWDITRTRSYPYLNDPNIDFRSPLATLVQFDMPYTFVPIGQLDVWEYETPPDHADAASLAAVYTIIARGIGITVGDTRLDDVKIDRYFWDDLTQKARWRGPVMDFAELGTNVIPIPSGTPLENANVIGRMNQEKLVILRASYTKPGGSTGTHWMLGTLYTRGAGNVVDAVIANDPLTGQQVAIDPTTKAVISPPDFPLENFRVNGYRQVTLQLPISDRRLKRDVVELARLDNGLGLYRYRYKGKKQRYVGVMAQEVVKIRPDAVVLGTDGYMRVNYGRLGLQLRTWKEWLKSAEPRGGHKKVRAAALAM